MKKIQFTLSLGIIALVTSLILFSCEDDDICTDEGQIPSLVADMYYAGTNVKLQDSIYYWAYTLKDSTLTNTSKDTIPLTSGNGNVLNKSTFAMHVTKNLHKKIIYVIAQGPDRTVRNENNINVTIPAKRDKIVLEYGSLGNAYTSKGCGFGLTFHDIKVSLVSKKANKEGNWIKNIETVNTDIKDASTTIVKLFADARN